MAAITRPAPTSTTLPEEVTSFRNIQSTFPGIYSSGFTLLSEVSGMIQRMRLETEIYPTLKVEENKETIKSHEVTYRDIQEAVTRYRETLESVNGQIARAIKLCTDVPQKDVRSFNESASTTVKVYDFCQKILPTLHDWHSQGTLLNKRFTLVMSQDHKHYDDSIRNFSQAINPSSWSLGGIASSLTSLLFSQPEAAAAAADGKDPAPAAKDAAVVVEKKTP
jgi:hypothetical protein